MECYTRLFEFLYELIDIQIKKFVALARIGIGPDARINAKLVLDEVAELLQLSNELLNEIEKIKTINSSNDTTLTNIFNQMRFYVEQEYLRGYAGWLIDENNIHTPELTRLDKQKEQLSDLAKLAQINIDSPAKPVTNIQRQCEHDSNMIAFYILDLAVKLRENPKMELDNKIPEHARKILLKHVSSPTSRFYDENISKSIIGLHQKCSEFITHSTFQKSSTTLSLALAKEKEQESKIILDKLLIRYQTIQPDSKLFSPENNLYRIGINQKSERKSTYSLGNLGLFSGMAVASATALYLLISYFATHDETAISSVFNFNK